MNCSRKGFGNVANRRRTSSSQRWMKTVARGYRWSEWCSERPDSPDPACWSRERSTSNSERCLNVHRKEKNRQTQIQQLRETFSRFILVKSTEALKGKKGKKHSCGSTFKSDWNDLFLPTLCGGNRARLSLLSLNRCHKAVRCAATSVWHWKLSLTETVTSQWGWNHPLRPLTALFLLFLRHFLSVSVSSPVGVSRSSECF